MNATSTPNVATVTTRIRVVRYGVATISRLLRIIGFFCKRALLKKRYSAKETYNLKEPTKRHDGYTAYERRALWGGYDEWAP